MAEGDRPLGFDGLASGDGEGTGDFTVEFTPSSGVESPQAPEPKRGASEEIGLLDRSSDKDGADKVELTDEEKVRLGETMFKFL